MLTVDYDRLGLHAGDTLLDLGCGFGRHGFEALRRGADVVACDMAHHELTEVIKIADVMRADNEIPEGTTVTCVNGDATKLPFADNHFDKIIASEVLEHVPDDIAAYRELARVLKPGGTMAVTIPSWFPEQVCWRLSDEYYAPKSPGGHVRIYKLAEVRQRLADQGLNPSDSHRAHSLHSPYWWLRCIVGPQEPVEANKLVGLYNRFLTWDIFEAPTVTRVADRVLNPVLGKSLVVYATKPVAATKANPESADVAA